MLPKTELSVYMNHFRNLPNTTDNEIFSYKRNKTFFLTVGIRKKLKCYIVTQANSTDLQWKQSNFYEVKLFKGN